MIKSESLSIIRWKSSLFCVFHDISSWEENSFDEFFFFFFIHKLLSCPRNVAVRRTLFPRIMQDTLILSPGVHMTRHLRGTLLGLHETGPEATTMDWKHPVRERAGLMRTPGLWSSYLAPSGASFPSLTHRNGPQQHTLWPPPTSDFPFGPCQQHTGVLLQTWTLNVKTWVQFLLVLWLRCYQELCCDGYTQQGAGTEGFVVVVVPLVERLVKPDLPSWNNIACTWQKHTRVHVISAGYSLCLGSESGAASQPGWAREGEEDRTEERRERGEGGGGATCRDKLLFAARLCTRCLHVSVTWPSTLQETPAAFHVRGKCEDTDRDGPKHRTKNKIAHTVHTCTLTHGHTRAHTHVHCSWNKVYCTDASVYLWLLRSHISAQSRSGLRLHSSARRKWYERPGEHSGKIFRDMKVSFTR